MRYDPNSNGDAENAVEQVTELVRAPKICLEQMSPKKIPMSPPLLTWLVEHTAWLLNTRVVGADGVTPYHQTNGEATQREA